jgi:hypothetical protein
MKILACCGLATADYQGVIFGAFFHELQRMTNKGCDVTYIVTSETMRKRQQKMIDKGGYTFSVRVVNVLDFDKESKVFSVNERREAVLIDKHFDMLYLYGCMSFVNPKALRELVEQRKERISYNSIATNIEKVFTIINLAVTQNIPIVHNIVYWLEPNLVDVFEGIRCKRISIYANEKKGIVNSNFYERYISATFKPERKQCKFIFGYTVSMVTRKYLSDMISKYYEADGFMICGKDKFTGLNELCDQFDYIKLCAKSEFSFIAPAYCLEEFSYQRFIECACVDCIPIIWDNCNMKFAAENGLNDLIQFYKLNNLFYNESVDLDKFVNSLDYDKLIKEFNELRTIKRMKKGCC